MGAAVNEDRLYELIDYWLAAHGDPLSQENMLRVTATVRALTQLLALRRVAAEDAAELAEWRAGTRTLGNPGGE